MGKAYDVLERGLNWTNADGDERREEPGAIGITDFLEGDIPGLLEDGLIKESAAEAKSPPAARRGGKKR